MAVPPWSVQGEHSAPATSRSAAYDGTLPDSEASVSTFTPPPAPCGSRGRRLAPPGAAQRRGTLAGQRRPLQSEARCAGGAAAAGVHRLWVT